MCSQHSGFSLVRHHCKLLIIGQNELLVICNLRNIVYKLIKKYFAIQSGQYRTTIICAELLMEDYFSQVI